MRTSCQFMVCGLVLSFPIAMYSQQQPEGKLATLYRAIFAGYEAGNPPTLVAVTNVLDTVPAMSEEEIRSALPLIEKALQSPRPEIQSYGELGLFSINQRQDSQLLIGELVPIIAENLQNSDVHIRNGAILALSEMKPRPPDDAVTYLLKDLQSDRELGPGIIFGLVQIDPNREDIANAIRDYLHSAPMSPKQRTDTLNALSTRPVENRSLLQEIAVNLTSQSEDVQLAAIHAIHRSGRIGIVIARPQLQRIGGSDKVSERLRDEANAALRESQTVEH